MKKILTIIIIVLAVFLIYLGFRDDDTYYLSIGDYLATGINSYGIKDYGYTDYIVDYLEQKDKLETFVDGDANNNKRIVDIIREIKDNKKIMVNNKQKYYQNALIKADLITISIGNNDLLSNVQFNTDFSVNDLSNKFEQLMQEYEELFQLLRKYSKEKIILIGLYNITNNEELDEFFKYANEKILKLSNTYDINYINIYDEFSNKKYFPNPKSFYPNKEGYKLIADKILELVKNT